MVYKTSKIVFSRFIFTIYDIGIQGVTSGSRGVPGGYKGLQGVTWGYRVLQGVRRDNKGRKPLQEVQRIIEYFFLTRTFPDTFSWSNLQKNQS